MHPFKSRSGMHRWHPYAALGVFCLWAVGWFGHVNAVDGAEAFQFKRLFYLDFEQGDQSPSMRSGAVADDTEPMPNKVLLTPHFSDGMEGLGLRSREPMDGMVLDLASGSSAGLPLVQGSLRFWFRPDWSSGEGPGGHASFFSFGQWQAPPAMQGYWGLSLDPTGQRIQFGAQSEKEGTTFISAPIQWTAGNWYEVALHYNAQSTWLTVDGRRYGPGKGIHFIPPIRALADTGLALGNTPQGHQPVKGIIDHFEIFNEGMGAAEPYFKYFALSAEVNQEPLRIRLQWPPRKGMQYEVQSRELGQRVWHTRAQELKAFHFEDAFEGLQQGKIYEYRVAPFRRPGVTNHIQVATFTPPNHHPGKVLLLVDSSHWNDLKSDLNTFKQHLQRDGWQVEMAKAPRHDDRRWKSNIKRIAEVKEIIHAHHGGPKEGVKVVLLIGHVAVPYSGFQALDRHGRVGDDHRGAWSCDAYYGDLDGVWRDQFVDHVNRTHPINTNRPGDGKFDDDIMPTRLEVAVGRIDFANLPSLDGSTLEQMPRRKSQLEAAYIRQYLQKNMAFRRGEKRFAQGALVHSFLPANMSLPLYKEAIGNASAWYGHTPGRMRSGDGFHVSGPVLWSFMAGRSGSQSFADGLRRTRDFNQVSKFPRAAFLMLYSSWHGDWNTPDAFLRACLASPDSGLAAMSLMAGPWDLRGLGRGESLANGFLHSANTAPSGASRNLAILGDPTLGNQAVPAISNLLFDTSSEEPHWTWTNPEAQHPEGVYIYRFDAASGRFALLQRFPPGTTTWTPPEHLPAGTRCMIRVGQWMHTPSGVFAQLSHGAECILP